MNTMSEFLNSLHPESPINIAANEYERLHRIFSEEATDGSEIPVFFAAATNLREMLEDFPAKPDVVEQFIGLLDSDVKMMRSIINSLRPVGGSA